MPYNLDLGSITLMDYREMLKSQNLLPSRRLLLEDIDKNFEKIKKQDVANIAQLLKKLSSPFKITAFSLSCGISEEYLLILKREAGTLAQKPVPLSSFPGIEGSFIAGLEGKGIKNSKDYYESKHGEKDELFCLCDLVRINGVGALAAKTFYEAGYRSVSEVSKADAFEMLKRVSAVNEEKQYYKAKLGIKDMQFCIDFAALLEGVNA